MVQEQQNSAAEDSVLIAQVAKLNKQPKMRQM